jgi:hypothetical protein
MKEDELNRLSVEVPSVATATYRYNLYPAKKLKSYFVLGASQIELKAIYDEASDATPDLEESYSGFVYGFAFEEALDSVPSLKVMGQWVNLYDGEALNIHGLSLGMRYDF